MSNVGRAGSSKKNNGWLVRMVDGKKKLALNEREKRAAENRKRLALMEELKFKKRQSGRKRNLMRRKSPTAERGQRAARNRKHRSLMQEVKMAGRLKKRFKKHERSNSETWRRIFGGSASSSPCKNDQPAKPSGFVPLKGGPTSPKVEEIKSKTNVVPKARNFNDVEKSPSKINRGNLAKDEEVMLEEAASPVVKIRSKSDVGSWSSDVKEEEEWPLVINPGNSLNSEDEKLEEATSLRKKPKLKDVSTAPTKIQGKKKKKRAKSKQGTRTMSLSNRSLPRENSGKSPIPQEIRLKEAETKTKSYKTQVFMDWKKKTKTPKKIKKNSEPPATIFRKKLTGLDPDVIAQTQKEISEFAEEEQKSSALVFKRQLTGVHTDRGSKAYISGWLEGVDSPTEAVGGLY